MTKKSYIEILFPNAKIYRYNLYDDYETKIEMIEKIYKYWGNYFEENWDKTLIIAGSPQRPVSRILDQLAYYLMYNSKKELTDEYILNSYKEQSIEKTEIPISSLGSNLQELFYATDVEFDVSLYNSTSIQDESIKASKGYDKRLYRFKHLQKIDVNLIEHITFMTITKYRNESLYFKFLRQIDSRTCLTIRNKYYDVNKNADETICEVINCVLHNYSHLISNFDLKPQKVNDKNRILSYAKKSYMNLITRFQLIELFKCFNIDPSLPYSACWAIVDNDGGFEYKGNKYKIMDNSTERILVYEQLGKLWFFDDEIKKINVG